MRGSSNNLTTSTFNSQAKHARDHCRVGQAIPGCPSPLVLTPSRLCFLGSLSDQRLFSRLGMPLSGSSLHGAGTVFSPWDMMLRTCRLPKLGQVHSFESIYVCCSWNTAMEPGDSDAREESFAKIDPINRSLCFSVLNMLSETWLFLMSAKVQRKPIV